MCCTVHLIIVNRAANAFIVRLGISLHLCGFIIVALACVPLSKLKDILPSTFFMTLELIYRWPMPLVTFASLLAEFADLAIRGSRLTKVLFISSTSDHPCERPAIYPRISQCPSKVVSLRPSVFLSCRTLQLAAVSSTFPLLIPNCGTSSGLFAQKIWTRGTPVQKGL